MGDRHLRNPAASTFTRPANTTAYASGDLVANDTDAADVVPLEFQVGMRDGSFIVRRARLEKSVNTTTNASFRLHLYRTQPTVTNGDNGAWLSSAAGYLGFIDIVVDKAFNDATGPAVGHGIPVLASVLAPIYVRLTGGATKIYGLLEARAAYTPGSEETFTPSLEIEPIAA